MAFPSGEKERSAILAEGRGDALGDAAVDARGEDAAAGDDGDLLAVRRDGELAGPAADGHDDLVVGAEVGGQGDGDPAGLGAGRVALGVDRAVVAEAERAVVGEREEADGVGLELGDRGGASRRRVIRRWTLNEPLSSLR